jgi:2-methylcitrate dehydratase
VATDPHRDEVIRRLAEYAVSIDGPALDEEVRHEIGRRLIDSLACAIGALDTDAVEALRGLAEERQVAGGCSVWGSRVASSPEAAALANGTAIRFLDFSDYTTGGHPSDNVAAVLAACEWTDATVDDMLAGIAVSYEVWGELGRLYVRYRGWDQGTTASIAAVCAVGRVLGLTVDQLANAIGIVATSNVSLVKLRRGEISAWKGAAVPYAAANALLTAAMAAKGITGPQDAFAGEFGFFQQVSGEFEITGLEPSARPTTVLTTGYKHWPVEYEAQWAVWLAQRIRDSVPLDDIETLDVGTSEWTWKAIAGDPAKWRPTTRETADHSLPYIIAVALVRGRIDSADFDEDQLDNPAYLDTMDRISVHGDPEISAIAHETVTFRARVRSRSGEEHAFEISESRSKGITDAELEDKWARLTGPSRLAGIDRLLADLRCLDGAQRVRHLLAPLTAVDAPPRQA